MRKLFKVLTPIAMVQLSIAPIISLSSCGRMYHDFKTKAPYLHEITYDDYRFDVNEETTKDPGDASFGCSSVRKGDFYGRNFDYVFNDTPEFVVHVNANKQKHRHESIGIATHFGLREPELLAGQYDTQLELIPNLTLDGINDAGLICSHNVVSMEAKHDGIIPETNPGASHRLHQLFVPRYILDNASNVDEAVDLLTKDPDLNIAGDLNGKHFLHVMIADTNKTVIVEFFKKEGSTHNHFDVVVENKTDNQQVMTNYYCNDITFTNDEKNGDERYQILQAGYDSVDSMSSMRDLMQRVKFSIAFNLVGHSPVPINRGGNLTSEWYSEDLKQSYINSPDFHYDDEEVKKQLKEIKEQYWDDIYNDRRYPPNPKWWITTHNSTYQMSELHLRVTVQENYLKTFDYYLEKK